MTESRSELFLASWKVFLDGVEIPHQGFSISYAVDSESTAMISLEPDPLIASFRPTSIVHIFVRDRYAGAFADHEDAYKLFWEGMLVGISGSKESTARFTNLNAVGLFSCLEMFKAFAAGGTDLVINPVVSGSTLPPTIVDNNVADQFNATTPLDLDFLAGILTKNMTGENTPYRDSAEPAFSDRIIKLLGYLSSHNALLRMQLTRYRLLDKICGIPDSLLQGYLKGTLGSAITRNSGDVVSAEDSIMSVIKHMMSYGFYRSTQVPAPFTPVDDKLQSKPKEKHQIDFFGENREVFQIYKTPYRNDMVLMPHMFFAMPPPCNLVFPDHIVSLTFSRDFIAEPTRVCIADPLTNTSGVSYVAPPSLLQNAQAVTKSGSSQLNVSADELFGILLDLMSGTSTEDQKSVYIHKGENEREVNMLKLFTNEELEKGILTQTGTNGIESAVTLGQIFNTDAPELTAESTPVERAVQFVNSSSAQEYRAYVTQLANYIYRLSKYAATNLSVRLSGHRWLVPGFSSVVFNKDGSYIGQVQSLTLSVSSDGLESSSFSMSEVRPLASFDIQTAKTLIDSATDLVSRAEQARTEQRKKAEERFTQAAGKLAKKLEKIRSDVADIQAAIPLLRGWVERNQSRRVSEFTSLYESALPNNSILTLVGLNQFVKDYSEILTLGTALSATIRRKSTKTTDDRKFLSFFGDLVEDSDSQFVVSNELTGIRTHGLTILKNELDKITERLSYGALLQLSFRTAQSAPTPITTVDAYFEANVSSANSVLFSAFDVGSDFNSEDMTVDIPGPIVLPVLNAVTVAIDTQTAMTKILDLLGKVTDLKDPILREAMFEDYFTSIDSADVLKLVQTGAEDDAKIIDISERLADLIGVPAPPSFYNKNLLNLNQLDRIYQEVLGCAPLYSTNQNQEFFKLASLTEDDRIEALSQYIRGLEKLNSLYPFLSGVVNPTQDINWFVVQSKSDTGKSTARWADEKIARKGTTMRQFLANNQLKKTVLNTSTADGIPAFQFEPTTYVAGGWDNTVFSKIVDLSEVVGDVDKQDPAIKQIRDAQTTAQYLKTSERQKLIRAYANRHFTQKGFDGS